MTFRVYVFFIPFLLTFTLLGCGSGSGKKTKQFSLNFTDNNTEVARGTAINIGLFNPKEHIIDSVRYSINNKSVALVTSVDNTEIATDNLLLGNQILEATVYYDGELEKLAKKITILNDQKPIVYTYEIINTYPHDQKAFTQGLEFVGDTLYESTGQKGSSSLRKVDYKTGKVLLSTKVPAEYFAEGITVWKDKIYQLTWQAKTGFIYDKNSLKKTGSFRYNQSKEGWGLCNSGKKLYKSDGSEKIWILNPDTLAEERYLQVTTNKGVKSRFNELEWVEGKIYANTWMKDGIAIINPSDGALEGVINLSGLRKQVTQHDDVDVLNGIAYHQESKRLFVTGKNWDKLFEIKIIPR